MDAFIEKFSDIKTCGDIPGVHVEYSGVEVDGTPIMFKAATRKATDMASTGIYTCSNVSDITVTAPAAGSYSVTSSVAP
jgi:hypothetical protein